MLRNVEDSLKDTKLTKEQKNNQKRTLEAQLTTDPSNSDLKNKITSLTTEIRNLEIKEKSLEETIKNIKKEQEKFPKDATKSISATESQKAAQEAERLALEGNGIIDVQQTRDEKENQEKIFKKEVDKLAEEIKDILHDKKDSSSEIDNPEDVTNLQTKIDLFLKQGDPELIKKYDASISDIKSTIEFAQGKINLIKLWKKKETEWSNVNQKINY